MMNKFVLPMLVFALAFATAGAQTTIFDFEGEAPAFSDFNGSTTMVIDNPDASGINTSSKVAENIVPAGAAFAGVNIPGQSIDISTDKGFSMQVWAPVTGVPVLLKLEGAVNAERQATFDGPAGQWQELSFDFGSEGDLTFTSVTVFMNFNIVGEQDLTFYWDNLQQFSVSPVAEPLEPAPAPDKDPANVISMFSDSYDDVAVDTWLTTWSAANLEDVAIAGNATKKYTSLNFAGIETVGPAALDLEGAGMTHLHVDIWTPNAETFRIKLVDFGGDGFGGDNDTEFEIPFTPEQQTWVSLDIPLMDFAGMSQSDVSQYIFSALPVGTSTIYMDNMYFYNATPDGVRTPQAGVLRAVPNPAREAWLIEAPEVVEEVLLFNASGMLMGRWAAGAEQVSIPAEALPAGMYAAVVATGSGKSFVVKLVRAE
ncbi:hypothetical protein [Phaeodactylibacter luteus]|uniref:T9SS type A sorting domain-containing protein n=1 Tax=Phaeodactylibacter luteus TaxID=1564516 RepID=A0A5C6S723_9BACT|nr:hypothetical protein [Phaeodactylibacter luteus]TXB70153.1 hypothetical protein FRY97_00165 [Phaeodactylibacter luteus]